MLDLYQQIIGESLIVPRYKDSAPWDLEAEPGPKVQGDFVTVALVDSAYNPEIFVRWQIPGEALSRKAVFELSRLEDFQRENSSGVR